MTGAGRGWQGAAWRAGFLAASLLLVGSGIAAGEAAAQTQDDGPCPPAVVGPAPIADRESVPALHRYPVDCAFLREIVQGFADGHFHPARSVRRDQMASFIARALDAADVELPAAGAERFTDVEPGSPHDESVHRLAAAAIVNGGPGGQPADVYGPALTVRRDQMASFLLRAAQFATGEELADQTQRFSDVPPGNAHFAAVNGAHEIGLVRGHGEGTYRPGADVRRDQMSAFMVRLLEQLTGADPTTVWSEVDLSGSRPVRSGITYQTPEEALDAIASHVRAGAARAEVSHRMTDWSASHGVVEVRAVPDGAVAGEDILVELRSAAGGWTVEPFAQGRAHCARAVDATDATRCA
ncbi:MAG: S-layer homology domain-containing protein [Egibacteraceae bacterium]